MTYRKKNDQVVAHYIDGTILKGFTSDFYPSRAKFRMETRDGDSHEVNVRELKALFFVRNFGGRRDYRERKGFFSQVDQGNKVLVEFFDGETLFGHVITYSPKGIGFFMTPGDPESNNIKVFVIHSSTKRVKVKQARKVDRRKRRRKVAAD